MKKRILYIGNKLSKKKGTVTTIETLTALLNQEGYRVITASSIQNKAFRMADMLWQTFKNRNNTDLVLIDTYSTQNFYYAVTIAKMCRFYKTPYIPILHGGSLPNRLKKSPKLASKLFNGAKTNIAPSMYLLESFKKRGYTNLTYIPNSIEIKNYPFLLRKEINPKLLWVRSFSELYNPQLAIKTLEILLQKYKNASLCMVGPEKDDSLQKCKELAKQKNLPVTFTGLLDKKSWITLSKKYDIFINTTNFDNTPISVIEAMALGLPVISTNVGGLPYLIENNKTGILVPPNNKQAFADAIITVVSDPKKAMFLAKKARTLVEGFDWDSIKEKWNKVLGE